MNRGSRFIFVLSALTFAAAAATVWAGYEFLHSEFPEVSLLKNHYPVVHYEGPDNPPTITITRLRPSGWVSLSEISRVAIGAILVSEDWAFYSHRGYDPHQIKEALKEDWEEGRFARGASTITQQVARNVFLDRDKNLWRKLKELVLAVRLEQTVGKRRILETYLNVAEWGEGIYGIGAASRHYFDKAPSQLTAREGAFLAMLLPSPKRYSQSYRAKKLTDYARLTMDSILSKMAQAHYLTDEERAGAAGTAMGFEKSENEFPPIAEKQEAGPAVGR